MNRITALKILNPILFISALLQPVSALVGLEHELFANIHIYNGILLVILILTHLALNFKWVVQNYFKPRGA